MYRKRCYRYRTQHNKVSDVTPRKKVKNLMKTNNRALVRRQLLLGAALEYQLKDNFEKIKNCRDRKRFVNTVIGDEQFIRKCKITKDLQEVFTKQE